MGQYRAAIALAILLQACGGDVRQVSPDRSLEDARGSDPTDNFDAGATAPDAPSIDAAKPDPCAPENRPICATVRERVVQTDSGECVLYVPHALNDPRPFDPNVLGIQITTSAGPRRLTYVDDASGCGKEGPAGGLGWYFVSNPPHLVFCPLACEAIHLEGDVVEVLVSCTSICPPP